MKNVERIREALLGVPAPDYFHQRAFAGWKPVAMIWEREIEGARAGMEEVPYGLEIAGDSLVENTSEKQILLLVMEGIVQDKRVSQIAAELNLQGHRTRSGLAWTAAQIFELLPRLVEVGPRVFPTDEWAERRHQIFARI